MTQTLAEAAASSTAHGIGKAASADRKSVRVIWILLFFISLALFMKSGFNQVIKLKDRRLIEEYHAKKVPFVFPDLYFCPTNPYSGSYPFSLTKTEADLINAEISRIESKIDELHSATMTRLDEGHILDSWTKLEIIQASLPFTLIAKYLVQRREQSIPSSFVFQNSQWKHMKYTHKIEFYLPGNLVCFKMDLTPDDKLMLQFVNSTLDIWLSTDPFFPEVNFTGDFINPITDAENNSIPFQNWHPIYNVEFMKQSGYSMLIVPPGAYPSVEFETDFQIGPGNAYTVDLEMFDNSFSEELHGTHCIADPPKVAFENPLTGRREMFNYSSAVCYMQRRLSTALNRIGCRFSNYPMLWEHRSRPRCCNVSEMTSDIYENKFIHIIPTETTDDTTETDAYCKSRIPCSYPKYSAISSVGKWPSVSRSTAEDLVTLSSMSYQVLRPGFLKLVTMAQQMLNGSHSAHLEGLFRMYLSESWLKVRISAASTMSDQGVLTWSYSVTDFLADTGGLLGLYIGCSLLTLCELLELLYILVDYACRRRSQTKDMTPEVEVAIDDKPKDVATSVDAEQKC